MEIIRDDEGFGIFMVPLWSQWNIRRCNIKDCVAKPTTIIAGQDVGDGTTVTYGLCEKHFQLGNQPEGANFTIVFDEYDAFRA